MLYSETELILDFLHQVSLRFTNVILQQCNYKRNKNDKKNGKKQSDSLIVTLRYYGNILHGFIENRYTVSLLRRHVKLSVN